MKFLNNNWIANLKIIKDKLSNAFDDKTILELISSFINKLKLGLRSFLLQIRDLKDTNYKLGMLHYENGNLPDAIFRFKLLRYFYPDLLQLNYFIGRCYIEKNQKDKAANYIDLYLKSNHKEYISEALFCLNIAQNKSEKIDFIPNSIVKRTFNLLAYKYSSIFLNNTALPQDNLCKDINFYLDKISHLQANKVLDLGCGTGYIAKLLKANKVVSLLHGVDLSNKMIEICNNLIVDNLPCYDLLFSGTTNEYFKTYNNIKFNIIIISKLLNYLSDIENLLINCKNILSDNGCIALNYKSSLVQTYKFDTYFEEFHYSDTYVQDLVLKNGFKIFSMNSIKFPDGDDGKNMILIFD